MPTLQEIIERRKKGVSEPLTLEKKVRPIKDIMEDEKAQILNFVAYKTTQNKHKTIKDNNTNNASCYETQKDVDWDKVSLSQDDLWFLFRLKFGIGTRIKSI